MTTPKHSSKLAPSASSKSDPTRRGSNGSDITADAVLKFNKPASKFLCPLRLNQYIQFLEFRIRDMENNNILFEVKRSSHDVHWVEPDIEVYDVANVVGPIDMRVDISRFDSRGDEVRTINYTFPKEFLDKKEIGTTLVFAVHPEPINEFRMIERHYFKDKLLKSFDFQFGFCIPNSVNTWESVYSLPKLDQKTRQEMIAIPGSTTSDSFYFVDGRLIMHNKATYTYV
ncbi:hypothetical protein HK097_006213 [Rhizophlyctis rosea]|uniref:GMP phosphodiesterase delta subunit domain-containing protein n=1 Tax=Rhizophlyctis rosea TaxID=64517 RepID=A0AAD5SE94_9FUNG|nr:hypothetical protein HK097_006213 [Rhizophlyctis rosea]